MRVEIFTTYKAKHFPEKHFPGFTKERDDKWCGTFKTQKARRIVKEAMKMGLNARYFEERYDRSTDYRKQFIKNNPPTRGRYRCVYCGKKLSVSKMVVDHVIPVSFVKKSRKYQRKFNTKDGVNDIRNLVASCWQCNTKKGTSTSKIWRIRAALGKHRIFWVIRNLLILAVVLFLSAMILNGLCQEPTIVRHTGPSVQKVFEDILAEKVNYSWSSPKASTVKSPVLLRAGSLARIKVPCKILSRCKLFSLRMRV